MPIFSKTRETNMPLLTASSVLKVVNIVTRISTVMLFAGAWFVLYMDFDANNELDYSIVPSLFGPGTYLAWVLTWMDYLMDDWVAALRRKLGRSSQHATNTSRIVDEEEQEARQDVLDHDDRIETNPQRPVTVDSGKLVQCLTIMLYYAIAIGWLVYRIFHGPDNAARAVAASTLDIFTSTAFLITLAYGVGYDESFFTLVLFTNGSYSRWALEYDMETAMWTLIPYILPVLMGFILAWPAMRKKGPLNTTLLKIFNNILVLDVVFIIWINSRTQSIAKSREQPKMHNKELALRPPWPKSECSPFDLDQMFALCLAIACLVLPRRAGIWKVTKKTWIHNLPEAYKYISGCVVSLRDKIDSMRSSEGET
jgi:multisubunit Na+/H+ antiporter MnhF subunit